MTWVWTWRAFYALGFFPCHLLGCTIRRGELIELRTAERTSPDFALGWFRLQNFQTLREFITRSTPQSRLTNPFFRHLWAFKLLALQRWPIRRTSGAEFASARLQPYVSSSVALLSNSSANQNIHAARIAALFCTRDYRPVCPPNCWSCEANSDICLHCRRIF